MTSQDLSASLAQLFSELVDGPPAHEAYMLNGGDAGLLKSLDRLTAEAASRSSSPQSATIAAHTDHVCYGLELMLRWSDGEADPWSTADWSASWKRTSVTEAEWAALRARLEQISHRWLRALRTPRALSPLELNGVIASVAHLAYHLGAIRQIDRGARGPRDEDVAR
jgi:hypothetical protein